MNLLPAHPGKFSRLVFSCLLAFVFFLPVFFLPACQAAPTPIPTPAPLPTPEILTVILPHMLEPVAPALRACTQAHPNIGLVVFPSLEHASGTPIDLVFSWGEDPSRPGFSALIGSERLAIITHPGEVPAPLSLAQLIALLRGEQASWPGSETPVSLYVPPMDDPQWNLLETNLGISFDPPGTAWVVASPQVVLAAVAETPGSLGLLPAAWVTPQVELVPLSEGLTFESLPVLVYSSQEPQGAARLLVQCLQTGAGGEILATLYP